MRRVARSLDRSVGAVSEARALVSAALTSVGLADRIPDGALAVSELVTNALVHTTGGLELRIDGGPGRLRVEVRDTSPLIPRPGLLGTASMSGRGLLLVARLTAAWGSEPAPGGKVVWFELAAGDAGAADDLTADDLIEFWSDGDEAASWPRPSSAGREEREIVVRGLPTAPLVASKARGEDLLREATLLVSQPDGRSPVVLEVATRLNRLMHELARIRHAIRGQALAAATREQPTVDLTLRVAVEDADLIDAYSVALDDADRLARQGLLLSPPPSAADAAFRRGYLRSIADQARGAGDRQRAPRQRVVAE
jgi:anti-sigma regulatory factor (Ser/Thr protein kinase)